MVDDHPIVRQGLALLINQEADMLVCGEAEEAIGAMHVLASSKPDVLIVDISLNGPDGLDLLKNVRTTYPTLPVLILRCTMSRFMRNVRCGPEPMATS